MMLLMSFSLWSIEFDFIIASFVSIVIFYRKNLLFK